MNHELRRRLSSELRRSIVAGPDVGFSLLGVLASGDFSIFVVEKLADETEELAKALPPDESRPWLWPVVAFVFFGGAALLLIVLGRRGRSPSALNQGGPNIPSPGR